jgi:hypothetical protein
MQTTKSHWVSKDQETYLELLQRACRREFNGFNRLMDFYLSKAPSDTDA